MARILSRKDVESLLNMEDTISILEKAFSDLSNSQVNMPQRNAIFSEQNNGLSLFMPAHVKGIGALGIKTVTVYKDNPAKFDLPTILGTLLLLDEKTGKPLAIMDAGYLTGMRTGGAAGLATKFLSRKNSVNHVIFGSGGMALTHACAVDSVRDLEKTIIYSIDPPEKKEAFAEKVRKYVKSKVEIWDDPKEALAEACILTLITSAKDPVIKGEWIMPGTHINGIGAHMPTAREIDTETVLKSKVFCDQVEACQKEAGDLMIPVEEKAWSWDKVSGSLGDVITGKIQGREWDEDITLFKSVGLAIQDISTAYHVFAKAEESNTGLIFDF